MKSPADGHLYIGFTANQSLSPLPNPILGFSLSLQQLLLEPSFTGYGVGLSLLLEELQDAVLP